MINAASLRVTTTEVCPEKVAIGVVPLLMGSYTLPDIDRGNDTVTVLFDKEIAVAVETFQIGVSW